MEMQAAAAGCTHRLETRDGSWLAGESHGLGQGRDAWMGAAAVLTGRGWQAAMFDARGHGGSGHAHAGGHAVQRDVVSEATVLEIIAPVPRAERVEIAHAGYTPTGDDSVAFPAVLESFLDALPPPTVPVGAMSAANLRGLS